MITRAELSAAEESKDGHIPLMIAALEGEAKAVKRLSASRADKDSSKQLLT